MSAEWRKYAFSEQALRLKEEDPENFVDDGGDIEIITIIFISLIYAAGSVR